MNEIIEFLKGKKSYILALVTVVLGVLQGLDIFILPEWAWPVIAGAGLTFLRAGVGKVAEGVKPK